MRPRGSELGSETGDGEWVEGRRGDGAGVRCRGAWRCSSAASHDGRTTDEGEQRAARGEK